MSIFRPIGTIRLSIDIAIAVIAFIVAAYSDLLGGWDGTLIAVFMTGALAVRRLAPGLSLGIAWVGAIVQMSLGLEPLPMNLVILGILYVTAAYGSRVALWAGLASSVIGALTVALYLFAMAQRTDPYVSFDSLLDTVPTALAALFGFGLSWTAGALVRAVRRADENGRAQERALTEAAAEHERSRIARDMHDVVAHSLAVVVAQANGARYAAKTDPQIATDALATISQTAGSALSDVRVLLAQLRRRDADGPQPTLADLDALFGQVRHAGVDLAVDIDPAPPSDVPAAVQLAIYRILQEALTNALRHGDGAATVRIAWREQSVSLAVGNRARPREAHPAGHGIIGMRERAQLAGGSLEVEHDDGSFMVRATIPWAEIA